MVLVNIKDPTSAAVARRNQSWINSFLTWSNGTSSPELFRRWAGIATIAAALERKVWTVTTGRKTFPNLYILLVGPAGLGKGEALYPIAEFLEELPDVHVASTNVSSASLINVLEDAKRTLLRPMDAEPVVTFNATTAIVTEFGVFLKTYDNAFMSILNDLWDNVKIDERKRGNNLHIKIARPCFNMIAGTTPSWLGGNMPEQAWGEGFASRLTLIYSSDRPRINLFDTAVLDDVLHEDLVADLRDIHQLYGHFRFEEQVQELLQAWLDNGCPPQPDHTKLETYSARRPRLLIKLLMIACASRTNGMLITVEDYQTAMDWMLEAEATMPDVFRAMRSAGSAANVMDETFKFVYETWAKEGKDVAQQRIVFFISQRVPGQDVLKVLDLMVKSNMLAVAAIGNNGQHTFRPTPRVSHGS